jgi:hypothetical protein
MTGSRTTDPAWQFFSQNSILEISMLWTIVAILLILWLLGFTLNLAGGVVHVLLVIAIIVVIVNLLQGRRPLG